MVLLELFNSSASVPLLGALLGLLVLFFYSSRNQDQRKEPPGPRPLPLIGNLLSLDFMKPHITLWEVRPLLVLFGPWSLPGGHVIHLIIQLFWLDNDWYFVCFFYQLSKKYGNVFTVYLGPKKVVVLAGYKTVKQALVNHADEEKIIEECEKLTEVFEQYKGVYHSSSVLHCHCWKYDNK